MKNLKRTALLLSLLLLLCTQEGAALKQKGISIVSWNVQTFFDTNTEGSEYKEFRKKSWNNEKYTERLKRLSGAIKALDADVVALQEVENEDVLHDIYNFLQGEWSTHKKYRYATFAKKNGAALGCAILSRFPIADIKVHEFTFNSLTASENGARPLLEVSVSTKQGDFVLFVNHWKSQKDENEESCKIRSMQEGILAHNIQKKLSEGLPVVACGDFNKDIQTFCLQDSVVCLREKSKKVSVKSLWFTSEDLLVEPGSYVFRGEWSRLDSFFIAGGIKAESFSPCTDGPWAYSDSKEPIRYRIESGKGYSDHLPIKCAISF